ncbi:MAG: galactose mutarotase [Treponema sp.]|nr:galactose mutarotase [Treponema sp.]MCL2266361.1 galactose mutarotase [Treponema sp.]
MKIDKKIFGVSTNGKKIKLWTLSAGDIKFSLTNLGAAWTSLTVPSRHGEDDVLLGYSGLDGYINDDKYLGVTVGRFANRIKNASFNLDGTTYQLEANNGKNTLHSGSKGFARRLWKSEAYEENEGVYVRFELESSDGDQGFPGKMKAVVSYGLTKSGEIICDYHAKVDKPCPVNLTNHAYFNLAGEGKGTILSHEAQIFASTYVEVDKANIPTGHLIPVEGSYFDFKSRRKICADHPDSMAFKSFKGYDHCFALDGDEGVLRPCAEVFEPVSCRRMKVFTTQPGVQLYTGNHLENTRGKFGSCYAKYSGFCLETQHFPDAPNQKDFISCIAAPGNDYHEKAVFTFSW